ncbi:Ig-like domain-containing protein [Marinobacter lipolyticus]|uniref:Ig-like domain-containing protein n=1 Tax=Marinobacter lipolyticus TaxID=209639 RepID=UPI003A8D5038
MTNFKTHLGIGVTALSLLLAGCGGGGGGPSDPRIPAENTPSDDGGNNGNVGGEQETFCTSESTVFEVSEFVPADGEQGVALNRSIRVTFNADVDAATVSQNSLPLTVNGSATVVAASYNTLGKAVVINPNMDLLANTDYQVTATTDLRALCEEEGDLVKTLTGNDSAAFKTGSEVDGQGPTAVTSSPEDGETLAPTDTNIYVEFDEEIDPQSVNANNFTVTEIDGNGNPVATVEGVINPVGNSIEFNPDSNLSFQTTYEIAVDTTITDLAGNGLEQPATFTFRTGGLVVLLDNTLLGDPTTAQSEGFDSGILVEGLHTLGGTLLSALEFGDSEDGLNSVDNALILQFPLVEDLLTALTALSASETPSLEGTDFTEYSSALVAVCDPKSISTTDPSPDCALALDLGLDATQLQSLADAFTGGNPEQIPTLIQAMAETFASGDFNNLPQELSDVLGGQLFPAGDGLGVELRLVDDSSIPLPADAENALMMVLDAFNAIPVLGELFNLDDGRSIVDLGLLEGSLLGVDLGGLASVDVLSGTQTFIGEDGVLNLGGSLFDLLLGMIPEPGAPEAPGGDLPLSPADLPLIGDLLNLEDISLDPAQLENLAELLMPGEGFEFDPATLPLVGDILAALPDGFGGGDDLPIISDLILLLDPANLEGNPLTDIPVLGDLVEQLLAFNGGEDPSTLPLVGELTTLLDPDSVLGEDSPLSPLADLLNPDQLGDATLLEDLLGLLDPLDLLGFLTP